MANVFVEPRPKSRREGAAITRYVVESARDQVMAGPFKTQEEAIQAARRDGHKPLVARVRYRTDKNRPDHWREA